MKNYIDGFVLPIPREHLDEYKKVAQQVALVWKEYGALEYKEFVGDDLDMEGIKSFKDATLSNEDEVIIFGWVVFASREARDEANARVPKDPRMTDLVGPLTDPSRVIFDASRMVYGGFLPLVG
ncbi:MAG: DUF1428 domain-containing protein [Saprospiraceae bacterium]|nr:DUF1428 domain-containing protein [Saprospiraceae bacterium]